MGQWVDSRAEFSIGHVNLSRPLAEIKHLSPFGTKCCCQNKASSEEYLRIRRSPINGTFLEPCLIPCRLQSSQQAGVVKSLG